MSVQSMRQTAQTSTRQAYENDLKEVSDLLTRIICSWISRIEMEEKEAETEKADAWDTTQSAVRVICANEQTGKDGVVAFTDARAQLRLREERINAIETEILANRGRQEFFVRLLDSLTPNKIAL